MQMVVIQQNINYQKEQKSLGLQVVAFFVRIFTTASLLLHYIGFQDCLSPQRS